MITQELLQYIQQQRRAGYDDEQIKTTLQKAGWDKSDINVAFRPRIDFIQSRKFLRISNSAIIIIAGILIVTMVGLYSYYLVIKKNAPISKAPIILSEFSSPMAEEFRIRLKSYSMEIIGDKIGDGINKKVHSPVAVENKKEGEYDLESKLLASIGRYTQSNNEQVEVREEENNEDSISKQLLEIIEEMEKDNEILDIEYIFFQEWLLGIERFDSDDFEGAREHYFSAERVFPNDDFIKILIGVTYVPEDNLDKAIEKFEEILTLYPGHIDAHLFLSMALSAQGQYSESISRASVVYNAVKTMVAKDLSDFVFISYIFPGREIFTLGINYYFLEDYQKAKEYFMEALALEEIEITTKGLVLIYLSMTEDRLGDESEAAKWAGEAIDEFGEIEEFSYMLPVMRFYVGRQKLNDYFADSFKHSFYNLQLYFPPGVDVLKFSIERNSIINKNGKKIDFVNMLHYEEDLFFRISLAGEIGTMQLGLDDFVHNSEPVDLDQIETYNNAVITHTSAEIFGIPNGQGVVWSAFFPGISINYPVIEISYWDKTATFMELDPEASVLNELFKEAFMEDIGKDIGEEKSLDWLVSGTIFQKVVDSLEILDSISRIKHCPENGRYRDWNEAIQNPEKVCWLIVPRELIELTPNIKQFRNLTALTVSGRGLTYLPPEIGQLTELRYLDVSANQIIKLPREINNLRKLVILNLREIYLNQFPAIKGLTSMEVLDLSSNKLEVVPPEIGSLTALKTLDLRGNNLVELPLEIGNLINIEYLYLSGNKLTRLPRAIGRLSKLKILDLRWNNFNQEEQTIIKELLPKVKIFF